MSDAAEKIAIACPKCGKRYQVARTSTGQRARCSCGVEFEVPALDPRPPAPAPARSADHSLAADRPSRSTHCHRHPGMPAEYACAGCHALICRTCDFPQPDGSHLCPTCMSKTAPSPTPQGALGPAEMSESVRCQRHPEVAAVARCQSCGAPVCETCVFKFPGAVYYCPSCATKPSRPLSSTRKGLVVWSMLMAGWVTFFLLLLCSGILAEAAMEEPGATIIGALIMIPGLAGLGMACGSLDKRAGNPPIVWVTVVWNGILVGAWILLSIAGLMMEGM